jgi:hypothetical protein
VKSSIRVLAGLTFFAALATATGSASTLLCQTGPVTLTGSDADVTLYTCAIPANAVATGKSIRVTASLDSSGEVASYVVLNGYDAFSAEPPDGPSFWQFTIANTGSTTGSFAGIRPETTYSSLGSFGGQTVSPATLPWSTGWTLEIQVFADTGVPIDGDLFTVEILD